MVLLDRVFERIDEFDIVHFHIDYLHYPLSRLCPTPRLTTLHGRLDLAELFPLYERFVHEPIVSISNSQRTPLPWANWLGTVYHGLPTNLLTFHPHCEDYLAFVGRISREKRLDRAIEIAQRCGRKLKVAAKVDNADRKYFEQQIETLLQEPNVEFVGEVNERQKDEILGNASALLFPIDWPEPFGLVMIESMACGTPVVAWHEGSVPEVLDEGLTGFVCESIEQAVSAVDRIDELDRAECRRVFERRFSAERMAQDYVDIYQHVLEQTTSAGLADNGRNHSGARSVLHSRDVVASG
jgi:glycosyltransferase involved in cell wall biosynthesis